MAEPTPPRLGPDVLRLDAAAECARISTWMREVIGQQMQRRGCVVALSGGIDSALCAALAVQAVGPGKVFGLLMPERESSPDSEARARELCQVLGIHFECTDITPPLAALGCYTQRDAAVQRLFPGYGEGWRCRIVIGGGRQGRINAFHLDVQTPEGQQHRVRLPHREYLEIVAATNFKQRVRKTLEYFHADRLNHAVVGTPNRLELQQGFFVKQGDGAADLKPIAHLYKTQVHLLARHLGVPASICDARSTTDTYTLAQGQDEFFFALPLAQMDLAAWAHERGLPPQALADALGLALDDARHILADIEAKRRAARHLLSPALMLEPVAG